MRRRRHPKRYGRRALIELLAHAGPAGCDTSTLLGLGFSVADLYELVRAGIARPRAEHVVDGERELDLSRLYLGEQGRAALAAPPR